jgi:hypothetical protein
LDEPQRLGRELGRFLKFEKIAFRSTAEFAAVRKTGTRGRPKVEGRFIPIHGKFTETAE